MYLAKCQIHTKILSLTKMTCLLWTLLLSTVDREYPFLDASPTQQIVNIGVCTIVRLHVKYNIARQESSLEKYSSKSSPPGELFGALGFRSS